MDPFSRKLFKNRDAREQLRGMGGIVASSPELAQTVQKYQAGGDVSSRRLADYKDWQGMSRAERRAAGFPVSTIGGQLFFDRFGVGMGGNPDQLFTSEGPAFVGEDMLMSQQVVPPAPAEDTERRALTKEGRSATQQITVGNMPYLYDRATGDVFRVDGDAVTPEEQAVVSDLIAGSPSVQAQIEAPTLATEASRVDELRRAVQNVGSARTPEERAEAEAELQRAQERTRQTPATPTPAQTTDDLPAVEDAPADTGTPLEFSPDVMPPASTTETAPVTEEEVVVEDDTTSTSAPIDFDTSYAAAMERLGGVMGKDADEDSKQKAMANLAMVGLAIAAGQSPNALTNIAQGALVGMQGIQKAEAAEEAQEREMRLAALKMAADEADLNKRLASAEKIAAMRTTGGSTFSPQDRLYNATFAEILNQTGSVEEAAAAAAAAAPGASQAQSSSVPAPIAGRIVEQGGVRYQQQADGTFKPLG